MKRDKLLIAVTFGLLLTGTASAAPGTRTYSGKELDHIAFPIGGLGSGMFCIGIHNQLLLNNLQVISQKYGRNL